MPHVSVIVFAALCCSALIVGPGRRVQVLVLASLLGLILSLVAQSTPRLVGDAREYLLMSLNLARFERPSVTPEDLSTLAELFPGETGEGLAMPQLRGPDGRQDFPHFWFYSLLASPFVGAARVLGAHPIGGFTALNVVLLMGVAALLLKRAAPPITLLVVAGPILWWLDKAHAEVLTFSMIAVAVVELRRAPWWSIVAFGLAATQNPPIAGAMAVAVAFALLTHGWRDRRVWVASAVGIALAALHPLYFYSRLRVWTGLYEGVDRHWPTWRELLTVAFDPNLGILVHDPFLLVAMAIALAEAITRPRPRPGTLEAAGDGGLVRPPRSPLLGHAAFGLIALVFLLSFTQTTNFNSGGTPDPSRYGLWLVPFAIPVLSGAAARAIWLKAVAAGSVAWCVWAFSPDLPDQYLRPTSLAARLWQRWPGVDNPLAEVFAERTAGHEPARPPVATAGCEKVLLWGDGSGAAWPPRCTPVPLPAFCQVKDALCYANRVDDSYRFVPATATPAWRIEITRDERPRLAGGLLVITQTAEPRLPMAIWHEDGWSYTERLSVPAPDVISREWRWMGDRAGIGVMASQSVSARLKITARALNAPRRLRLNLGDVEIATLLVGPERGEYQTSSFALPAGTSEIALESLDGADTPGTGDPRRLSVAVFRIELVAER